MVQRVLIMGAAGRDFHVFNTTYRGNPDYEVVAFTAEQIPNIDDRRYPPELAGEGYPEGIPIEPEADLVELIARLEVDRVVFAYSDVSYDYVSQRQVIVEAAGAEFAPFEVDRTMVPSTKPVVAVCAVRTGCGKSQTTRHVVDLLRAADKRVVVIRHPMPYGDLAKQAVQRFADLEDLARHECTIEEMEEYEPHIRNGSVVYAGVDYEAILREAEKEADVILWDGGNNDTPFYRPDLWITLVDPLRAGHELDYFPGRANLSRADVVLINKMDQATPEALAVLEANISEHNPAARIVRAESTITVDAPDVVTGKRALVVEDGPSLTHGGTTYGAGILGAKQAGARELVDPRPFLVGSLRATFEQYPDIGSLLPAMGYGPEQIADLQETINVSDAEVVVIGTPIDLGRIVRIDKPHVRVTYDLDVVGEPTLASLLAEL